MATSLKVFFLVMPVPLAELPFQGSGCRGMWRGRSEGGEERRKGGWRPLAAALLELAEWAAASLEWGGHLIVEGRRQDVVDHLLVEDGREAA